MNDYFPGFRVRLFLVSDLLEYEMIFGIVTVVEIKKKKHEWLLSRLSCSSVSGILQEMIFSIVTVVKKPKNMNDYFSRLSCSSVSGIRFTAAFPALWWSTRCTWCSTTSCSPRCRPWPSVSNSHFIISCSERSVFNTDIFIVVLPIFVKF